MPLMVHTSRHSIPADADSRHHEGDVAPCHCHPSPQEVEILPVRAQDVMDEAGRNISAGNMLPQNTYFPFPTAPQCHVWLDHAEVNAASKLLYSTKAWRHLSLANLANIRDLAKLYSPNIICQTLFAKHYLPNFPARCIN